MANLDFCNVYVKIIHRGDGRMESQDNVSFKRLQHRLNYLEIRASFDNNEEHKKWLSWNDERMRLKDIIDYNVRDEKELKSECFNYGNYKIKAIAKALHMYLENNAISEIVKETKLSKSSIYNYIKSYKMDKRFINKMYQRPRQTISELEKYQYKIADDFETACIRTYKEAQERIFKITGVKISIPNIFNFLINHNFKKTDGYYKQVQTIEIQKQRLLFEKVFLTTKKDEVRTYILNNHLESDYRLIAKIRKEFNIRYIPRSWLSHYLNENGIIDRKK